MPSIPALIDLNREVRDLMASAGVLNAEGYQVLYDQDARDAVFAKLGELGYTGATFHERFSAFQTDKITPPE